MHYRSFRICDTEIRVYSSTANGTLNWKQDFGGDANHFLRHVIATPDTGVLALVYRYDENAVIDTKGDMYWIKFNKDGSQDLDYLSGFTEVQVGIEDLPFHQKQITVFPNPASAYITFQFSLLEKEGNILLYNSIGQLIKTVNISAFTKEQKVDISDLIKGIYFWRMSRGESGKFVIE